MSRHKQSVVKRLKHGKTTGCSLVGKDHQYHSSFGGDWVGLWWFADWLIKPRGLSALTGRLLIWRGVWTRISAFHRLAGTSRPANHVTAGPVLQERRGMGQESMCLLLMLCACQSRPFSSQFSAFLFLVLSVVSLSSGSACPNDA